MARNPSNNLETLAAPLLLAVAFGLVFWALPKVSLGELLATPATRPEGEPAFRYLMSALTAMVGFWATLSLNIPDFSRYAKSQRSQIAGQIIGLPLTMFLFSGLGVLLTAASLDLVGETISDPINLIGRIDNTFWVIVAMLVIILATISTNTAANIVSPTNSFQNLAPKYINETRGVLLTGIIGFLLMSWELAKKLGWFESDVSLESLYSNWLVGYSSLLGSDRRNHDRRLFCRAKTIVRPGGAVQRQRSLPGVEQTGAVRIPGSGEPDDYRYPDR